MPYRFEVRRHYKGDLFYRVGLADSPERANLICNELCSKEPDLGVNLRIWDYEDKKWIFPECTGVNPDGSKV